MALTENEQSIIEILSELAVVNNFTLCDIVVNDFGDTIQRVYQVTFVVGSDSYRVVEINYSEQHYYDLIVIAEDFELNVRADPVLDTTKIEFNKGTAEDALEGFMLISLAYPGYKKDERDSD